MVDIILGILVALVIVEGVGAWLLKSKWIVYIPMIIVFGFATFLTTRQFFFSSPYVTWQTFNAAILALVVIILGSSYHLDDKIDKLGTALRGEMSKLKK